MENFISVGYVSLKVSLKDSKFLHDLLESLPIEGRLIAAHDMHLTLMYDQENPIPATAISKINRPDEIYRATIKDVGMLGDEDSKYRAVVLHLESPQIDQRFDELSIFMNHSFDSLMKHVSVIYGAVDGDLVTVKSMLTDLVGSSILLYGESFATIKGD